MSERELVYLCKTEPNSTYQKLLFDMHYQKLRWWVYRLLQGKFYSIPFDWYELDSLIFESFIKALKNFDLKNKKYSFAQAVFTVTKSSLFSYALKFMSNKQVLLNNAYSYDCLSTFKRDQIDFVSMTDHFETQESQQLIKKIKNYLLTQPPLVQKIVNLKCDDVPNRDIAKHLNIPVKKVSNTYNSFILKSRKEFSNC